MKLAKLILPLVAALAISGCALFPDSPATADAKRAVQVALTAYADVYQPAVLVYGRLPACPAATAVCHDSAVLAKLKAADLAVTASIVAAQGVLDGTATDTGQLTAALTAIQQAEVQIAGSGALSPPK